jgi:hypothetical protein
MENEVGERTPAQNDISGYPTPDSQTRENAGSMAKTILRGSVHTQDSLVKILEKGIRNYSPHYPEFSAS